MNRNHSASTSPLHNNSRANNNNNGSRSQQQQQRGSRPSYGNRNVFNHNNTNTFYASHQPPFQAEQSAFEKIWKNISNSTQEIFHSGKYCFIKTILS